MVARVRGPRETASRQTPAPIPLRAEPLLGGSLDVEFEGAEREKLWALKSRLEVPFENVIGAESAEREATEWLHGFRLGGTHIPGVISAGRFYSHGQLVFWDVHEPEKAIAIQLRNEHFDKLIVEVADPKTEIERVRQAAAAPAPA